MLWWLKDTNNRHLDCSQAVADSLGIDSPAAIRGDAAIFYPQDAEAYFADDLEVIHTKKPKTSIVEALRVNGRRILVHTRKIPIFDKRGRVVQVSVFAEELGMPAEPPSAMCERFLRAVAGPNPTPVPEIIEFNNIAMRVRVLSIADGRSVALLTFTHEQHPISIEAGRHLVQYVAPGKLPRMSHFYQDDHLNFILEPPDDWRWAAEALGCPADGPDPRS